MENVLNKLRDRVSSTVYQVTSNLSTALPGNALTREYEIVTHVASAGPQLVFKVFDAIKKTTKEDAALFVLDKKILDNKFSKRDKELILDVIRKGVSQLTRLRHPSLLTVQHNIEESRDSIAFATEPVMSSLANLLGMTDNMPNPIHSDIKNFEFFDVEIKYGLLQISEGLAFLHNDVKLLHRNISPESIIVNKNGVWKIAGFDFCATPLNANENILKFPQLNINYSDFPSIAQPNLDYIAPEYVDRDVLNVETNADMFSLGLLTYTLYNKGKPLLSNSGTVNYKLIEKMKRLPQSTFNCIPEDSRNHIKMLLSIDTTLRPDAHQFSKLHIFEDVLVKTLQYLDSLYQWDNLQKSHFYKGLPEVLSRMPKRVKLNRVVSSLAKEYVNPDMVPFVLPNILLISQETNDEEFEKWIIPELVNVFKMREPIQIGIILMQNMDFLVSKFKSKPDSLREHILPLIYRSLDSDVQQIQELCLNVIPSLAHLIDYSSIKNSLLPRIKKVVLNTKLLSVRVNCLICLGKILEYLDKWLVIDEVLPVLSQIPSKEPAVIMASIGIYKLTISSNKLGLTKEVMATQVLPYLIPLSIENGLSLQQFQTIMTLIREMLSKVEDEHQIKLEQLNSIKVQHQSLFNNTQKSPVYEEVSNMSNNSNPMIKNNITSPLSLEDKERLAKQKEMNERLKTQSPLLPQNIKQIETSKPKDLTSTLISSNISNLSLNSSQTSQTYSTPSYSMSYSSPMNSQQNNEFKSYQTQNNTFQPLQQSLRPNLTAFDKLVIPDLKKPMNSQPMKAMNSMQNSLGNNNWSTNTSIINNNNLMNTNQLQNNIFGGFVDSNSKQTKQLSKSEMEDFLS